MYSFNHASDRSLALIDELGSGTDPDFGGAIAQAILDTILRKQVWGVATTHYYNLKLFAGQHTGIRNAAMRFDDKNLVPLVHTGYWQAGQFFCPGDCTKNGTSATNHIRG